MSNVKWNSQSYSRLYSIWNCMKYRCYREKDISYKNYGAKGIRVCNEWIRDFIAFKTWAEQNGYDDSLSIDRIDNSKDYSPLNCKWSTKKVQQNNTNRSRFVTHNGITKTISQWADFLGLKYSTILSRVHRNIQIDKELRSYKNGNI